MVFTRWPGGSVAARQAGIFIKFGNGTAVKANKTAVI